MQIKEGMIFSGRGELCNALGIRYNTSVHAKQLRELSEMCDYVVSGKAKATKIFVTRIMSQRKRNYVVDYNFKYELEEKILESKRDLSIIGREIRKNPVNRNGHHFILNEKWYKIKCNKCGYIGWKIENSLSWQKTGCPACCATPQVVVSGINDIDTTEPWMTELFLHREDAKKYTKNTSKRAFFKCPYCGKESERKISSVYLAKKVPCICGDGISFPNKFMYYLLSSIGLNVETEKIFSWSDRKIYDDYFEFNSEKYIVENHGIQHYTNIDGSIFQSLSKQSENDRFKRENAINNGIDKYFEIDCRESTVDYLKNSIVQSGLLNQLGKQETEIDWKYCGEMASSNFQKYVCDYYKEHKFRTIIEITNSLGIPTTTAQRYLTFGNNIGWCVFNKETSSSYKSENMSGNCKHSRPLVHLETGLYYRDSKEFVRIYEKTNGIKFTASNVRAVCSGNKEHTKNMHFKYISREEFNSAKSEYPDRCYGNFFEIESQQSA